MGVSPVGTLAYQTGQESEAGQLTWFDRSGRPVDSLPADASGMSPQISPDGSLVAVHKFGASGGIWVTDLARKSMSPITFGRNDVSFVWSPSSKRLAFLRVAGKDVGVHIVDVTDASKDQFLKGTVDGPTSWSPDEKYLLLGAVTGRMILFALDGSQKLIPVGSRNGGYRLAAPESLPTANPSHSPPMSLAGMKSTFRRCRQALCKRRCPSTADRAHGGEVTERSCFSFRRMGR